MRSLVHLRRGLALLRLLFLYTLFCTGTLALILAVRAQIDANPRTAPLPATIEIPYLGVTVELEQYDDDGRVRALERLRAAGFGWVRQRVDWGEIEPSPGDYRWAQIDAILAHVVAADLIPVVVLDGSPRWARDDRDAENPLAPPADPATFARFAAAFAARYNEIVRFYQIWDEPNLAPHWGDRLVEPVAYARLLEDAATAIRAADVDAVIILGALAPTADRGHTAIDEVYFLQRLYAAGAAPFFDVVAMQPFGFGAPPDDPRSRVEILNFGRAALIRRVMVAAGDGDTPIWAVRFGWNRAVNTTWRTVTAQAQIRYTEDALILARSRWPWLVALGWAIDRPAAPPDDPRWGFALVTPDDRPTPLLYLFAGEEVRRKGAEAQREGEREGGIDRIGLIVVGLVVVLWWGMAAARRLPLSHWLDRYRSAGLPARLGLWTLLIVLYYFATWPPLIGLCWAAAALLILARPPDGLLLAAALIPFHFRHKEIDFVAVTLAIAPAQAAILCTIPAMVQTFNAKAQRRKNLTQRRKDAKGQRKLEIKRLSDWVIFREANRHIQIDPARRSSIPSLTSSLPPSLWVSASLRLCVKTLRLRFKFTDCLALAFLGISLLSAGNVWHWPGYWAGIWGLVITPLIFYAAVRVLVTDPGQRCAVVTALGIGGALAAGIGLIGWASGGGVAVDSVRRLIGLTFSPNQTALYLIRALFVLIGIALMHDLSSSPSGKGSSRVAQAGPSADPFPEGSRRGHCALWWLAVGVVALALLLTGSRGALILGLPAGVATMLWLGGVHPRRRTLLALVVIGGAAALIVLALLGDRLQNSETVLRRFAIWQGALDLWMAHPLTGVGPGGFFWRYPAFITPAAVDEPNLLHAHNLWLNFATTWGILGLIWLGALIIWLAQQVKTIRNYAPPSNSPRLPGENGSPVRPSAPSLRAGRAGEGFRRTPLWMDIGLLAALIAALAHAQVDTFALLPELAAVNWLIIGILAQSGLNKNLTNRQYISNAKLVKW
jgi:O-antigen ligase